MPVAREASRPRPRVPGTAEALTPSRRAGSWIFRPRSRRTGVPFTRRRWVSRAVLLGILVLQAMLSLQLQNTAFADEALYLYAGHLQLDQLLDGRPLSQRFTTYFSGSPVLYPTLAAAVDAIIWARRSTGAEPRSSCSGTTVLLYSSDPAVVQRTGRPLRSRPVQHDAVHVILGPLRNLRRNGDFPVGACRLDRHP